MHEQDSIFTQLAERDHERICFHQDPETGLKAIVAIHSTALGNALGGTRRWYYESEEDAIFDVLRLSKGMTYKAAVSGLPMGGAKSVILLPRRDQPRHVPNASVVHSRDSKHGLFTQHRTRRRIIDHSSQHNHNGKAEEQRDEKRTKGERRGDRRR